MTTPTVIKVAPLAPRLDVFDYLPPEGIGEDRIPCGGRVRIPLGNRNLIGVVVDRAGTSALPPARLRRISGIVDHAAIVSRDTLALLRWSARYYRHPLGDVLRHAIPRRLREGHDLQVSGRTVWYATPAARDIGALPRAPRQSALLDLLRAAPGGLGAETLSAAAPHWREPMRRLVARGLAHVVEEPCLQPLAGPPAPGPALNSDQEAADTAIRETLGQFRAIALEGVTGSGKTEVYLHVIEATLHRGLQALVLVPEIGLTPQLTERFTRRVSRPVVALHSGMSDTERHCAWTMAHSGDAGVVIGTRSAVFTPLAQPGVIIVDEEHDPSLKQHDGFRYHARDLAVFRARQLGIPVILGSATPSLETLNNVTQGKYSHLRLPRRAGVAAPPRVRLVDVRRKPMEDGLSEPVRTAIQEHLSAGGQVLVFLNRRGYSPALVCHDCGWIAPCHRCDSHLTLHRGRGVLRCHHCDSEFAVVHRCPQCGGSALQPTGQGTERLEEALNRWYPDTRILRIDRDTIGGRGAIQNRLAEIRQGHHQILVGTQMLSKGHDFPNVTLVVVVDVDQGLYSTDFRAPERLAQQVIQVTGRAGRADRPGTVLLQTHLPDHPLLQLVVRGDYRAFARNSLEERRLAGLPPFRHLAALRAEAHDRDSPMGFLGHVRRRAQPSRTAAVQIWGPVPAPMERRAGRYRAQLLFVAPDRPALQHLLDRTLPLDRVQGASRVRWSLDVDPVDLF